MKVYIKKGNTNYKEKRLIKDLRAALTEQGIDDFTPAKDFEELKQAHSQFCIDEAQTLDTIDQETTNSLDNQNMTEKPITNTDGDIIADTPTPEPQLKSNTNSSDPLNRSEPIIRDYVMDNYNNQSPEGDGGAVDFAEPVDFADAFSMPSENEPDETESSKTESTNSGPAPVENHVNPSFNEMDNKKAKKKSQRFAKQVTGLVCDLAERGFIYATTKDITDAKLAEYEASGEMDLTFLVQLADGQEVAIKQFFANQRALSEHEGKIGQEEREELTEALAEVFMEKGIAPTPTQELALTAAKVFGVMLIKGVTIQKQNAAILEQLREQAPAPEQPIEEQTSTPVEEEMTQEEENVLYEDIEQSDKEVKPKQNRRSNSNEPITWNDLENIETYS